ncbi:MAG: NUDIX hydrolase [Candidatus Omnitrophica bacterium]|nr:NUDIX hydrolase [Candidatus Omnitrophota bacterium]
MVRFSFDRHAVTVDIVLVTIHKETLKVLLVKRDRSPFGGKWALPGGGVGSHESVDEAALRLLQKETQVGNVYLEQLYTFGELKRDPRGRVITVAYYALVNYDRFRLEPHLNGGGTHLFTVNRIPSLAFDHQKIIRYALERLRHKVNYTTICFQLLPDKFTLSELQKAYEVILNQKFDKRNFRKKMLQLNILKRTGEKRISGPQRPAELYSFTESKVLKLQERGILIPF